MAAQSPISPLAPKNYPALPPVEGVRFASVAAGVRYSGRADVMMVTPLRDGMNLVAQEFVLCQAAEAELPAPLARLRGSAPRGLRVWERLGPGRMRRR